MAVEFGLGMWAVLVERSLIYVESDGYATKY
jgi:hypothetical protein